VAGAPWSTLESRPNDFVLLVQISHHGDPLAMPLTGTADGLVDGQRRSVPLTFVRRTNQTCTQNRAEAPFGPPSDHQRIAARLTAL